MSASVSVSRYAPSERKGQTGTVVRRERRQHHGSFSGRTDYLVRFEDGWQGWFADVELDWQAAPEGEDLSPDKEPEQSASQQ